MLGYYTVYILYAADNSILYVGRSIHPRERLIAHRAKMWGHQIHHWLADEYDTQQETLAVEGLLIRIYKPPYNRLGVSS